MIGRNSKSRLLIADIPLLILFFLHENIRTSDSDLASEWFITSNQQRQLFHRQAALGRFVAAYVQPGRGKTDLFHLPVGTYQRVFFRM